VLLKLLTKDAWCKEDPEVQAVCLMILARVAGEAVADGRLILRMRNGQPCDADRNGEEKARLKTVELGGLRPMLDLLKSEELDVAGKSAYAIACHMIDSPVRLAVHTLGGVECFLFLMQTSDDIVINNAALALSQILQHVEAKDELYKVHGMKVLIDCGLMSDSVDVQENSARAVAFAIEQEGNLKDLRKMNGIVTLIEMLAALPDTDRAPNDRVRQSACFALSVSAFDSESRTEIRENQGLLALSNCLSSENWRVQEEALMALANCAFDIPCKQTIGSLGGMKNGISLLSNPADIVVANACVALGRLVFDFMSGVDFMEQDGVPQLFAVLDRYVVAYKTYREYQDKIDAGEEVAIHEGEEAPQLPDLKLGKSILENCKACGEQGNVRQVMRQGETNFLSNIFVLMKHEDEVVSGMACQALANAVFDVEARPQLLEMEAVPEFVRCLEYKDVDTQLSAARALSNFALDSVGRDQVREIGALPKLVAQLHAKDENGKDAIEPRRAAILAIGKCAWDRTSAVELCDIGALKELLQLMETHWKQLGEAASDSVERLLKMSQSAKMWLRGDLDYTDTTNDGWYDMGPGKKYESIQFLQSRKVDKGMEVLFADPRQDKNLRQMVESAKKKAAEMGLVPEMSDQKDELSIETKRKVVKMMSEMVSGAMGGSCSFEDYNDWAYAAEITRCKELRRSNVLWIGDMRRGVCRHRAFLFKFLCDQVMPGLARLERAKIERGAHVGHAWNCVKFYGDNDADGQQFVYTVDLMHDVGALFNNGTDLIEADEWVARYQHKDVYHFLALQ